MLYFSILKRAYTEIPKQVFSPNSDYSFSERIIGFIFLVFGPLVALFALLEIREQEKQEKIFKLKKRKKNKRKISEY